MLFEGSKQQNNLFLIASRSSSLQNFFYEIGVLKHFVIFTEMQLWWSLFLIKSQGWRPATSLKRDSKTSAFQWILPNFWEQLFHRTAFSFRCFFFKKRSWLLYYRKFFVEDVTGIDKFSCLREAAIRSYYTKRVFLKNLPPVCNFIKRETSHRCFPANLGKS